MFVTMHNYKIGEGTQLDVARTAEEFLGTAAAIPGFRAYYMIDGGDHRIGSVSIFDTREGVEQCDKLAAEFVTERLGGFRLAPVEVTEGQVLASQASRQRATGAGSPHPVNQPPLAASPVDPAFTNAIRGIYGSRPSAEAARAGLDLRHVSPSVGPTDPRTGERPGVRATDRL